MSSKFVKRIIYNCPKVEKKVDILLDYEFVQDSGYKRIFTSCFNFIYCPLTSEHDGIFHIDWDHCAFKEVEKKYDHL